MMGPRDVRRTASAITSVRKYSPLELRSSIAASQCAKAVVGAAMTPVLISRIACCSRVASLCSTMAATLPSAERTMRPYPEGSSRSIVSSDKAPRSACSTTSRNVASRASGSAPNITKVTPSGGSAARAQRSASPVPRGGSCRAQMRSGSGKRLRTASAAPSTMQIMRGVMARAVASTCASKGFPPRGCSTLGSAECIRLPFPAARIAICSGSFIGEQIIALLSCAGRCLPAATGSDSVIYAKMPPEAAAERGLS